eukprot:CAMPEP_0171425614 /NCGR_PEP_ID=MMETSP0881-20121228/3443_1 /TAXON_ID=67004 /ORGANISM="Thalassiosira weissflogii, Strain CCMP1336" /LENGTH=702 /DNA_ID=CAMNT_0011944973 /DNA_START=44 /DNA_END=2149 /DNA_ORIENTATION=+
MDANTKFRTRWRLSVAVFAVTNSCLLRCGVIALKVHQTPMIRSRCKGNVNVLKVNKRRNPSNHSTINSSIAIHSLSPPSTSTSPHSDSPGSQDSTATGFASEEVEKSPPALSSESSTPLELYSVDVRYDRRFPLTYDPISGRYLDVSELPPTINNNIHNNTQYKPLSSLSSNNLHQQSISQNRRNNFLQKWTQFLHTNFVPEGVDPSYYKFMRWRILQRYINANVHVIGTQSLLMGLRGMQRDIIATSSKTAVSAAGGTTTAVIGAAAATNWVLKDTLGKFVRMIWASKMGRKFDPDAKRWRFRSALIYALGNGLEVSTYLHPGYFLVLAMLANSCKQMSMLTSSATRNALYNSFKLVDGAVGSGGGNVASTSAGPPVLSGRRNVGVENIGDITAKGEAQIAVVDLCGIGSGIFLSKAVGVSVQNVFAVWIALQIMEIFCMYHEMRSVVYKTFNFERMYTVLEDILLDDNNNSTHANDNHHKGTTQKQHYHPIFTKPVPTPEQIASKEKIFLPPDHLARRAIAFGSPGRTALDPNELQMLINDIFRGEKYFLVVGQDVKNARGLSARVRQWRRQRKNKRKDGKVPDIDLQEHCHIVLHAEANNLDILKSALALVILRRKLVNSGDEFVRDGMETAAEAERRIRSRDCEDILRETRGEVDQIFPQLLRELIKKGWQPPLRSMLGRVSVRAEWPIKRTLGLVSE